MKDYGYKVWYWLGGYQLGMDNCENDANFAWRLVCAYNQTGYKAWLEYTKEGNGGVPLKHPKRSAV